MGGRIGVLSPLTSEMAGLQGSVFDTPEDDSSMSLVIFVSLLAINFKDGWVDRKQLPKLRRRMPLLS